jgi:hypothetical protein
MLDIQRHGRWKSLTVFSYVGATAAERLAVTNAFLSETTTIVNRVPMQPLAIAATAASSRAIGPDRNDQLVITAGNTRMLAAASASSRTNYQVEPDSEGQLREEMFTAEDIATAAAAANSATTAWQCTGSANTSAAAASAASSDSWMNTTFSMPVVTKPTTPLSSPTKKRKERITAMLSAPQLMTQTVRAPKRVKFPWSVGASSSTSVSQTIKLDELPGRLDFSSCSSNDAEMLADSEGVVMTEDPDLDDSYLNEQE